MKLLLSLLLMTFSFSSKAQWQALNSGKTTDLVDVCFSSSDTGYVVGYDGTALKTTDAGLNWTSLNLATNTNLNSVFFIDNNVGFVAGDTAVYKTIDGGVTWVSMAMPSVGAYQDLTFVNNQIGFCTGDNGGLYKTMDGGVTWVAKTTGVTHAIVDIQFPVSDTGYAVQRGYNWEVLKTVDGGDTWTIIPIVPINNLSNLETVYFTDANTGYIGGWYISALIKTTDGGTSWASLDSVGGPQLYAIQFVSMNEGFATGWQGEIYYTNNAGASWIIQNSGVQDVLYAMDFTDISTGYIVGSNGIILKYNGAITTIKNPISQGVETIVYPNPSNDFVVVETSAFLDENTFLVVYNLMGEIVLQQAICANKTRVDLSSFSAGVYAYKLTNKEQVLGTGMLEKN